MKAEIYVKCDRGAPEVNCEECPHSPFLSEDCNGTLHVKQGDHLAPLSVYQDVIVSTKPSKEEGR